MGFNLVCNNLTNVALQVVLDYDSDGVDVIPEEENAKEEMPTKASKNLFTNLTNRGFECDTNPSSRSSSRCSTPPAAATIVTDVGIENQKSSSEVLVNTVVSDNQIVLAKKISIFDLAISDIEHIEDKPARDWIVYGIHGFKTLLQFAEHLRSNKIEFDLRKYVKEEFPPHLQFFDPLDITEIVKTLSGDFINRKLEELGDTYRPLLGQRGKRTKQYDYLIPHKAAAMRNTLHAVTLFKQKMNLKHQQVQKVIQQESCRNGRRDKVRNAKHF